MSHRFFQNGNWQVGATLSLDADEAHHALRVLRLHPGDAIEVFNGKGVFGTARILEMGKRNVDIKIEEANSVPNPWQWTLAFSLGKPPSIEFILRRVTEVGVRAFQPLQTQHSQPGSFKAERWHKILLEVCKQCQEHYVPELLPVLSISKWLDSWKPKPVFLCDETERVTTTALSEANVERAIVIGPEGGWHSSEIEIFRQYGAHAFGLGRNRLRAETAALVAVTLGKSASGEIRR